MVVVMVVMVVIALIAINLDEEEFEGAQPNHFPLAQPGTRHQEYMALLINEDK
jgi:hypothetical protein